MNEEEIFSQEYLEHQRDDSQRAKISLPEAIILLMTTGIADTFEIVAFLALPLPSIGQVAWFGAYLFGLFVSSVLIIWSLLRGVHGRAVVQRLVKSKLIPLLTGTIFDALTAGVLPIRTISLALSIWLTNHFEAGEQSRILGLLEKA